MAVSAACWSARISMLASSKPKLPSVPAEAVRLAGEVSVRAGLDRVYGAVEDGGTAISEKRAHGGGLLVDGSDSLGHASTLASRCAR